MPGRRLTVLAAAALALALVAAAAAPAAEAKGKLTSFESKISSGSSGSKIRISGGDGKAALAVLLVRFFVEVFPYLVVPQRYFEYAPYPYCNGQDYLMYGYGEGVVTRPVTFETRGGYHADLEGIHGFRAYAKARLSCYFTLDFDAFHHIEPSDGGLEDSLTFAKVDALFNIANTSAFDLDFGFGWSYVEGLGIHGGANVKITGDVFPVPPLGIHFMAAANVFGHAEVLETELALGIFFFNMEVRAGYRSMWIEDVSVHGPLVEVALWF